jgi:glycosyltransferase involved in cell wall biosynthesis
VVITKNEEANIQDCLKSVRWADELVVVDAESRDKTVELARACGAKVSVRPWPGFGLQKNFGMAQASSDWILILDADERVTEELCGEVKTCLAGWRPGVPVAYRIPRRIFRRGSRGGVDYQKCACFGREPLRYNDVAVHEISLLTERLGRYGHLDHYTDVIQDHFEFGL